MVIFDKYIFHIQTKSTSYVFYISDLNKLENLYFGKRINHFNSSAHIKKRYTDTPNEVHYTNGHSLQTRNLELSTLGKGDFREPSVILGFTDFTELTDFTYKGYEVIEERLETCLPHIETDKTLIVKLEDEKRKIQLELMYKIVYETDVIIRTVRVINGSNEPIQIKKIMSFNLDLDLRDFDVITFNGKWSNERQLNRTTLGFGQHRISSTRGYSSANTNPGFILAQHRTDEDSGDCFAFNILYSGSFEATVEKSTDEIIRIQQGISSQGFSWNLKSGDCFLAPEAVLSFSSSGLNGLSQNLHKFVNEHLIKKEWRRRKRPIVFNTWEAMYFDFDEEKLLKFAKAGKKLGMECFVLDDGWFLGRNNAKTSLGDWEADPKKLPSGIGQLAKEVHKLGLQFGLWFEPEMISRKSRLFKEHPEWVIAHPLYEPSEGRHQLILDMSNPEVIEYLYTKIASIIVESQLDYIKWDMNRPFSDFYSPSLMENQGHLMHQYVLGLYNLLDRLTKKFPKVLFESCASGGSRFDYGMLYYTPQIWTSDNTDPHSRVGIQYGTSYFYPQSVMGCHVGSDPNPTMLRRNLIENRFNVAAFGAFGYELNILILSEFDRKAILGQIKFFKQYRSTLQFGKWSRISSPFDSNNCIWQVSSNHVSLVLFEQGLIIPRKNWVFLKFKGLDPDSKYRFTNRQQFYNIKIFGELIDEVSPIKFKKIGVRGLIQKIVSGQYMIGSEKMQIDVYGDELTESGIALRQPFDGSGYENNVRYLGDLGSRIYIIEKISD